MSRLRELVRHYRNVWKLAQLAFLVLCWGCSGSQAPTFTEADLHKASCTAKGETIIALTEGETEQALRLQNLVAQDEDCRAVFGDAAVRITVATATTADGGSQ